MRGSTDLFEFNGVELTAGHGLISACRTRRFFSRQDWYWPHPGTITGSSTREGDDITDFCCGTSTVGSGI